MTSFLDTVDVAAFAALNHSRATAAGIDPFEYGRVTAGLSTLRDWPAAFRRTGREHMALAETARTRVSAGGAFLDAAQWFHFATILPHPDRAGHAEAADALWRAMELLDPAAERVDGSSFTGLLRRPADVARPPIVVIIPGMDSSKEEFHTVAEALLRRGVATLAIDGPGQGERAPATSPEPAYEKVVAEAIDRIDERADLDAGRIGAIALSLGGYYGVRSQAALPRISAGATVSGVYGMEWDELPPFVIDTLTLRTGGLEAAREFARHVDLTGVAEDVRGPLLIVEGGQDVVPGAVLDGAPFARRAPRGEHLLIPEGDHLVGNARWKWLPYTADWLAEHLG